ncbi:MAG TPA: hypothetical protein VJR26_07985 [Candidatus Acidoferrales bacterium]|nr:hypothetical protein [Candidatus Acidoferrales bacterium]
MSPLTRFAVSRRLEIKGTRVVLLAGLLLSLPAAAQKHASRAEREYAASLPAAIWRDPGDISKRNLFYGAGGRRDAPDLKDRFKFIKEDLSGTNPKFDIEDSHGRKWRVKLGHETRPETAATRLLWVAGYFVDEDYFAAKLRVDGLPKLRRGEKFVLRDGTVLDARLELRRNDIRKLGNWSWFQNKFEGGRQFNGLRVMMCLMDDWDLKTDNNSIYLVDGERDYAITDLGASFGKTGSYFTRSKGVVGDYARAAFIARLTPTRVDFVFHSRPPFFMAFRVHKYHEHARWEDVARNIPIRDAKWIGNLLGRLSPDQLRDCFRAAGYDDGTATRYAEAVQQRIAQLNRL